MTSEACRSLALELRRVFFRSRTGISHYSGVRSNLARGPVRCRITVGLKRILFRISSNDHVITLCPAVCE